MGGLVVLVTSVNGRSSGIAEQVLMVRFSNIAEQVLMDGLVVLHNKC